MYVFHNPYTQWPTSVWLMLCALSLLVLLISLVCLRRQAQLSDLLTRAMVASVLLCALWLVKAQLFDALYLHLLGVAVLTLVLGAPMSCIALAVVVAVSARALHAPLITWGAMYVSSALLPVLLATLLHRLLARVLPQSLFVFIFVRGFFVAAAVMGLTLACNLLMGYAMGWVSFANNPAFWMAPILLGWGEGFLSGLVTAIIIVYRPEWLHDTPKLSKI